MIAFIWEWAVTQAVVLVEIIRMLVVGRTSPVGLTSWALERYGVVFRELKDNEAISKEPLMILSNHRSWTDFFMDTVLTGGASYLSRMMVVFGVPASALWAWLVGHTWFFKRQRGLSRQWLTEFFRTNWRHRAHAHVIVYPEGHRNLKTASLKLKTGCFEVAYNLKKPVQVVITTNKEQIVNEKAGRINKGVVCTVAVSEIIKPDKYESLDDWFKAIQALWDKTWERAYSSTDADSRPVDALPLRGAPRPRVEPCIAERLAEARAMAAGIVALVIAMIFFY